MSGAGGAAGQVTIVTVTYNSAAVIGAMLDSVPPGVRTIVVDNASTDDTAEVVARSPAELVAMERNGGFGVASNAGARMATTPFLLFLNPDTTLAPGALEALVAAAERYPHASAFNPTLIEPDGRRRHHRGSPLLRKRDWAPRTPPQGDCELPVLFGSALFCRRAQFEAIGGFDERIFLYHEDDDLSLRLKRFGPLMHIHDAEVHHARGGSTPASPRMHYLRARYKAVSALYARRKHGYPAPLARAWVEIFLYLAHPKNLLSTRRRARTRGVIDGTLEAMRAPR